MTRRVAFGYDIRDLGSVLLKPVKDSLKFKFRKTPITDRRPIVAVQIGPTLNACLPKHTPDPYALALGVCKRVAFLPPVPEEGRLSGLRQFVLKWAQTNLVPLHPETDFSFESWISETQYPEWRKNELRAIYDELPIRDFKYNLEGKKIGMFMKDEFYTDFKFPRGIYARKDPFKVVFGPYIKRIEQVVFKHPAFIKYVPVSDRPKYIESYLYRVGAKVVATDFSSFEAQFTKEMMENCEDVLYEYMLSKTPGYREFLELKTHINGTNVIDNKYFTLELEATRQSGEMNTSLGNGFSNLMFMLYICEQYGCTNIRGVVEGDDGLFVMDNEPPTPAYFAKFGLVLKAEYVDDISSASFCGIIYHSSDLIPLTDVRKVLATTGWYTGSKWMMKSNKLLAILRCKALSVYHQYNGCPVLTSFALAIIRKTMHLHKASKDWVMRGDKSVSSFQREMFLLYVNAKLPPRATTGYGSRLVVEEKFGVPVGVQRQLEKYFDDNDIVNNPMMIDELQFNVPPQWTKFGDRYTRVIHVGSSAKVVEVPVGFDEHYRFNVNLLIERLKSGLEVDISKLGMFRR